MKKLMMAVAIVCAAVGAQAAQIQWGNTTTSRITDLTGANLASGKYSFQIFLVDADGTQVASAGINSMSVGVLQGASFTYTYGEGEGQYSQGDTFTLLAKMTVDSKDYEMAFGNYTISATDNTGKDTFTWAAGTYGGLSGTSTAGSQASWAAVPEPTSGLLLLLGMAGLALRRKQK